VIFAISLKMGDEFDVDDLLEAPYKVKNEPEIAPFFTTSKSPAISICIVLSIADSGLVKGSYNISNCSKPKKVETHD